MTYIGQNAAPDVEKSNAELAVQNEMVSAGQAIHEQTIQATHKLVGLFEQSNLTNEIQEIRIKYGFNLSTINPETHPEDFRQARSLFIVLNDLLKVYAKYKTLHNKIVKGTTP